ncbi:MAG: multidrug effflux MFS transporter [Pseudomonadota bacterium]
MSRPPILAERIAILAVLISLVALSIDAMLPALPAIAADYTLPDPNTAQLILTAFVAGLGLGQLVYGPVSDSFGRRGPILVGLLIYLVGTVICSISDDFNVMLAGRALQGVGAAGPRVVSNALVRDEYAGAQMARIMSFVMAVFIVVPAIAPFIGQVIQALAGWRMIFTVFFVMGLVALTWFSLRYPETHPPSARRPLSVRGVSRDMALCLTNRTTLAFTIAQGLIFGGFFGYLTSAQQIFSDVYGRGAAFPGYFAVLALIVGGASFVNGALVRRVGLIKVCAIAIAVFVLTAAVGVALTYAAGPGRSVSFELFFALMIVIVGSFGFLFGNFNAAAMEPMGRLAGSAAAVIAFVSTLVSIVWGTITGQAFDGTVMPLFVGFLFSAMLAAVFMALAQLKTNAPEVSTQ